MRSCWVPGSEKSENTGLILLKPDLATSPMRCLCTPQARGAARCYAEWPAWFNLPGSIPWIATYRLESATFFLKKEKEKKTEKRPILIY